MASVIRFILVDDLWRMNRDAVLPLGDFETTLEEIAYDQIPETGDETAELAAEMHRGSIQHWATRLADYVGHEEMIPREWALVAATDALAPLEDGHHRLAAAKTNGLRILPVAFPSPSGVGSRDRYALLRQGLEAPIRRSYDPYARERIEEDPDYPGVPAENSDAPVLAQAEQCKRWVFQLLEPFSALARLRCGIIAVAMARPYVPDPPPGRLNRRYMVDRVLRALTNWLAKPPTGPWAAMTFTYQEALYAMGSQSIPSPDDGWGAVAAYQLQRSAVHSEPHQGRRYNAAAVCSAMRACVDADPGRWRTEEDWFREWWSRCREALPIRDAATAEMEWAPLTTGARRAGAAAGHDVDPLDRFAEAVAGFARRYATGRRGKASAEMISPFVQFYRHGRDVLERTHEGRVALGMLSDVLEQTTGDEQYHDRGIPCLARYPGGKCQSSDWIVPLLPKHTVYVEMFGGVASVLLRKPRAEVEIYNDVSGMLAETLAVLAHEPAARRLQAMALDYAANGPELTDRFFALRRVWHDGKSVERAEPDMLMRVLVFLFGLRMFQTPVHAERMTYEGGLGPGQNALQMQRWLRLVLELSEISSRTAGVVVYQTDWRELVRRLEKSAKSHKWKPKEVLVYCDPPYPEEAISDEFNALYGEHGDAWGPESHRELVAWATKTPWQVAVSGMLDSKGKSPYRELERKGFRLHKQKRRRSSNQKDAAYTECLWIRSKTNKKKR